MAGIELQFVAGIVPIALLAMVYVLVICPLVYIFGDVERRKYKHDILPHQPWGVTKIVGSGVVAVYKVIAIVVVGIVGIVVLGGAALTLMGVLF